MSYEIAYFGTRGVVLILMAGLVYLIAESSNCYNQKWMKWVSLILLTVGIILGTIVFKMGIVLCSFLVAAAMTLMMIQEYTKYRAIKTWVMVVFWISLLVLITHLGMLIFKWMTN